MRLIQSSLVMCMVLAMAFLQCAKDSEQSKMASEKSVHSAPGSALHPSAADGLSTRTESDEGGFFTSARLKSMLILPMEKAKERMLEYHVNLSYQTNDFHKSRAEIINIISQYGFLKTGTTDVRHTSHLYIQAAIQAKDIYRFLLDMDRVGTLLSENIRVNDLTEEMVISQRRIRREEIRIERKQKALSGMPGQAKNWQSIEESISRSEDSYDQSEHAKWKVLDRISWANVTISLEPSGAVHVPPYKKALLDLVDLALWIPYALIYLFPLMLIFILARWKWPWIKSLFGKHTSTE